MNGQMGMFDEDGDEQEPTPEFQFHDVNAAAMNAVGSDTGRVERESSDTSRRAAFSIDAKNQRGRILEALREAGISGLTSIEAAAIMPLTRQGGPQVSNRAASRLGELWESGVAYVVREGGRCVLGECHEHAKPRVIHKPVAPCMVHGKPLTRDKAAIWRSEDIVS